jgi:hypothetical protein
MSTLESSSHRILFYTSTVVAVDGRLLFLNFQNYYFLLSQRMRVLPELALFDICFFCLRLFNKVASNGQ